MKYFELPAPAPLNALVRCFWFLCGDDSPGEPQVVVADGRFEIVLHLGDPFLRLEADGLAHRQDPCLLAGQLTAPIRLKSHGVADVVGIRFRTAAAGAVLRCGLPELTDRVESLADYDPTLGRALVDAAMRSPDPGDRIAALTRVLSAAVADPPDRLVAAVARALDVVPPPPVGRVADLYGVGARTLERRVLAGTGLAPSRLRRVLRFRRTFRMLDGAPVGTWARVAGEVGYFDQAHMVRDFRRFAGAPPSNFFRTEPDLARAILNG